MLGMMSNDSRVNTQKGDEIMNHTRQAKTFIGAMMLAAVTAGGYAVATSHSLHLYFALAVLGLAGVTSRMKVKLPGIDGNMSVNLPFLLTAIVSLSSAEAVVITCVSTMAQCWPRKHAKWKPEQIAFNVSMMAFASSLASLLFHAQWSSRFGLNSNPLGLALAATTLFLGQTLPVAGIVAVSENKAAGPIWWNLAQLSFPYYVVSAGVTSMVQMVRAHMGWELALAVFPIMYGIHRSYSLYFGKMAESSRPPVLVRGASA
jgi:hypothetical protein